jgi:hypothetical protein
MSGYHSITVIGGARSVLLLLAQERKSTELIEQRLGIHQVGGIEALGEPAADGGQADRVPPSFSRQRLFRDGSSARRPELVAKDAPDVRHAARLGIRAGGDVGSLGLVSDREAHPDATLHVAGHPAEPQEFAGLVRLEKASWSLAEMPRSGFLE